MSRFDQEISLVTGGASGLGKAIAQRLSSDGATVVITDIQADLGLEVAAECNFLFLQQDVSDERRWNQVIGEIEKRYGRLDVLVNNAGILGSLKAAGLENTRLEDWNRVFAINVAGVFLGCRAAIPAMRRAGGGSIVNISSVAALQATPSGIAYGASKAAVRQLTKSVAQHCAEQKLNIRCNSVHPGTVRTPLLERAAEEIARVRGISVEEQFDDALSGIPLGDFTRPEDVAAAVSFLASEEARRITGTKLIVDGGVVSCDTYHRSAWDVAGPSDQIASRGGLSAENYR